MGVYPVPLTWIPSLNSGRAASIRPITFRRDAQLEVAVAPPYEKGATPETGWKEEVFAEHEKMRSLGHGRGV